jgi:hypothetical protein
MGFGAAGPSKSMASLWPLLVPKTFSSMRSPPPSGIPEPQIFSLILSVVGGSLGPNMSAKRQCRTIKLEFRVRMRRRSQWSKSTYSSSRRDFCRPTDHAIVRAGVFEEGVANPVVLHRLVELQTQPVVLGGGPREPDRTVRRALGQQSAIDDDPGFSWNRTTVPGRRVSVASCGTFSSPATVCGFD